MIGHVGKIATHVLLACLALLAGRYLVIDMPFTPDSLLQAGMYALSALIVELLFRVERAPWRFVSASDHLRLFRSAVMTAATFMVLTRFLHPGIDGGLRTVAGAALIQATLLSALRIFRRSVHERMLLDSVLRLGPASMLPTLPRLLIVGSTSEAEAFLRAPAGLGERYSPIGVVSPEDRETGDELRGVCVLGSIAQVDGVLGRLRDSGLSPSAILFLTDSAMSTFGAERLGRLKAEGVRLLRRHGVVEMGAAAAAPTLREISIEELLSRPPVRLDPEPVRALVAGRRVLVTGAGGSIGSELCRQIAASGCAQLTMVDASEFNLFHIDREIAERHPALPRREILCDVRDAPRVTRVFADFKPDIVFHAAALKHVTLVENHPCEGVRTNVIGTRNVAMAAKACGAAHLALISTDKAVAPTSVMGAAKRVAEAVARQYGGGGDMRVSIVRFGNVLGSAGSVVPIFQQQIARGGPVTLTDADVERYFMTIPEAVQLVLRAVALSMIATDADEAGVLTLEMGEPVKIIDLAKRMIELQGLTPGRDIEIKITGLRPGEKLTETLVDVNEVVRAKAPGIMEAVRMSPAPKIADDRLETLDALAGDGDEAAVRAALFDLVEDLRQTGPSKVVKIRAS